MKGTNILAWSFVAIDRAYFSKSYILSKNRLFVAAIERSSSSERMSQRVDTTAQSQYRVFLEKKIREKKMTLAADDVALNKMINNFYIPVYNHLKAQLDDHTEKFKGQKMRPPLFVGISAPQGYGKTTLTNFMQSLFAEEGKSCVSISLDDFYATGMEQDMIAKMNPNNPLLQFRGNAGTHDIALISNTLEALKGLGTSLTVINREDDGSFGSENKVVKSLGNVLIPQYNKSLRGGRGDREAESQWINATAPVDVVLFEGWMLGFTPVAKETVIADMRDINSNLIEYKALHEIFDAWLMIAVEAPARSDLRTAERTDTEMGINLKNEESSIIEESNDTIIAAETERKMDVREIQRYSNNMPAGINAVYQWRLQAERNMKIGLTDQQVADFISRFMPAYVAYLPALYTTGPQRRIFPAPVPVLKMTVDIDRFPISSEYL